MQETQVRSLGQEDSVEKEVTAHSSILAWEMPWTEEPGGLQSRGSERIRHGRAIKHTDHHLSLFRALAADSLTVKSLFLHSRRRQWHPTPIPSPGESHGWRSLVGCSPWGRLESDTTERLHFHFSLSCIREGNGSPLQCSRLEDPRDGKPSGLPSMGSHRVGHDWSELAASATHSIPSQSRNQPYIYLKKKTHIHTWNSAKCLAKKDALRWKSIWLTCLQFRV